MSNLVVLPTRKVKLAERRALRKKVKEDASFLRPLERRSTAAGLDIVDPYSLEITRHKLYTYYWSHTYPNKPEYTNPGQFDPYFFEFKSRLRSDIAKLEALENELQVKRTDVWGQK